MWLAPTYNPDKTKRGKTIISLVPSLTELLFDLGLEKQIIGRTKFCIHPSPQIKQIQVVGGTKNVHIEKIRQLNPDIVIANKEENTREDIESIRAFTHVYLSDISDISDLVQCIQDLTDSIPEATGTAILTSLSNLNFSGLFPSLRVAYLIWYNPLMTIGLDTFIHYMLTKAGLINVFGERTRYPETSWDELQKLNPDLVLLSSEPFPFTSRHQEIFQEHLPGKKVLLADGEMFSWYGSRILSAPAYLRELADKLTRDI